MLKSAPKFGFGSETRNAKNARNESPGPNHYKLNPLVGNEGKKQSMHQTIDWSPEKKENSYKPGPSHYNPDFSASKKKEPSFGVGKSQRDDNTGNQRGYQ